MATVVAAAVPLGADGSEPTGRQLRRDGRLSQTADPQPLLQAWLQRKQGLPAKGADQHARRLTWVFDSEQAALDSLPATFAWCRGPDNKDMTGLQTAQLLDRIARKRRENSVKFFSTAQVDWQLIDCCIRAYAERLDPDGKQLPKNTRLAEVLCSSSAAAQALGMRPGHVAAWLEAVQQRLPAADLGAMLLRSPALVTADPTNSVAVIDWVEEALRPNDLAAFFRVYCYVLKSNPDTLAANLANLQHAAGLTAEQAQELALKQPQLLSAAPDTVQLSAAWRRQQFPDPVQLFKVLRRGQQLLTRPVDDHLQRNAGYLQLELEWSAAGGQLAAFIKKYPSAFATVNFVSPNVQAKLLFLTEVAGVDLWRCLTMGGNYLKTSLNSMAAKYVLVKASPHAKLCITLLLTHAGLLSMCCRSVAAEGGSHHVAHQGRRGFPVLDHGQGIRQEALQDHWSSAQRPRARLAPQRGGAAPAGAAQVSEWVVLCSCWLCRSHRWV